MIDKILAKLEAAGVMPRRDEIESRYKLMTEEFGVPEEETGRSIVNYFLKQAGKKPTFVPGVAPTVTVAGIAEPGQWLDVEAKVVELWAPTSDSISQVGLIGDETGVIKFVSWAKAKLPAIEESKSYLFKNVVADEFNGRMSIKFNKTSEIVPLDHEIQAGSVEVTFHGAIVAIQAGSGYIKRCPECKRVLKKGACEKHGRVNGTDDMRIKAVIDDGHRTQELIFNREMTEKVVGITLDHAKAIVAETLDYSTITGMIETVLLGRYFTVTGNEVDRYLLVKEVTQ
jgi:replication factor A1